MSAHLIVFVKNPEPGTVKTRLQTRYSPEQAAEIYRAFILDTLANARTVPAQTYRVAYAPSTAKAEIQRLCGPPWQLTPQAETDLGDRMYTALDQSLQAGATRAVIVGTDIPSLPAQHIRQAFDLLSDKDVVLGPSTDGGYYLVGLSRPIRSIFQNIEWSTDRVFIQTLERIYSAGLPLGLVPPWYDIDTPEELDFLLAHARALEQAGQLTSLTHTQAYLSTLT